MAEELTIVTRFRAEVDEQNRALASTSTKLTALAKQLDSSVEGFDRFRSTVDGAVDRLKLFGIRGQRMADAINKNIHDPIKRAQFATKLFIQEQKRIPNIMDRTEGAFRGVGLQLDLLKARLGHLVLPLKIVAGATLALAAAIGKKLFDATKKYVETSKEHALILEKVKEDMEDIERLSGKAISDYFDLDEALREYSISLMVFRGLMRDGDIASRVFRGTLTRIAKTMLSFTGPLGQVVALITDFKDATGLSFLELMKLSTGFKTVERAALGFSADLKTWDWTRSQDGVALADRDTKISGAKVGTKKQFEQIRKDEVAALRKANAAELKALIAWTKGNDKRRLKAARAGATKLAKARADAVKDGRKTLMAAVQETYDRLALLDEINFKHRLRQIKKWYGKIADDLRRTLVKIMKTDLDKDLAKLEVANRLREEMEKVADASAFAGFFGFDFDLGTLQQLQSQIDTLKDSFVGLGSAVGQAFGAMIVDEYPGMKDFGNMILAQLGNMAIQWGSFFMLIGAGLSFIGGGGAALIGIGLGLTMLGGALTALSQRGGNQPKGAGGGAAAFDPASMARDILPTGDERKETIVQVFVAGDQIRDPIWRTVNEGIRTNRIPLGA